MTPYRGPAPRHSAITRTAGRTRVLFLYVALLAVAAAAFALAPTFGWIEDTFVAGPSEFMLLFRSAPYQRAFCEQNHAPPVESPETGRAALVSLRRR
jgi:hypothetical protein